MKIFAVLTLAASLLTASAFAATPEQEKAFVDAYKKAIESGDKKALAGFLYTEGAQAEQIEFFTMMQEMEAGSKVSSIELVTPSAADAEKMSKPMTMPDGKSFVMGLKPYKQLVVVSESKDASGSGKSTRRAPVAEKNGKLVIPVPVPAPVKK
jgi:hypothetical protein